MKKIKKTEIAEKKKQILIGFAAAIIVVALDQITKYFIRNNFLIGESKKIIPYVLDFTHLQNTGAAWGILKGNNSLFIWVSIIAIGIILYNYDSFPKPSWAKSLILAGIIGNLIDRIFLGYVVDFIDFKFWPVFNVSDTALSISVAFIFIYAIIEEIIALRKRIS